MCRSLVTSSSTATSRASSTCGAPRAMWTNSTCTTLHSPCARHSPSPRSFKAPATSAVRTRRLLCVSAPACARSVNEDLPVFVEAHRIYCPQRDPGSDLCICWACICFRAHTWRADATGMPAHSLIPLCVGMCDCIEHACASHLRSSLAQVAPRSRLKLEQVPTCARAGMIERLERAEEAKGVTPDPQVAQLMAGLHKTDSTEANVALTLQVRPSPRPPRPVSSVARSWHTSKRLDQARCCGAVKVCACLRTRQNRYLSSRCGGGARCR